MHSEPPRKQNRPVLGKLVFRVLLIARVVNVLDTENGNFEDLPRGVQPKVGPSGQSGRELSGFALCGIVQPNQLILQSRNKNAGAKLSPKGQCD